MELKHIEKAFYKKGYRPDFEEAKEHALYFFEYVKMTPEWEKDDCAYFKDYWYGICDNWDLNIFMPDPDISSDVVIDLYPVNEDGKTTNEFTTIG